MNMIGTDDGQNYVNEETDPKQGYNNDSDNDNDEVYNGNADVFLTTMTSTSFKVITMMIELSRRYNVKDECVLPHG